jgi:RNA polymerase sigma-70 factor (ECF subfamily)
VNEDGRSDGALVASTARGDQGAFALLVRRHIRAATLLAAQLLGDRDEAEDIVQRAFGVVYRDARKFDERRPFAPWFFAIVRRLASNHRSREARRARLLGMWQARTPDQKSSPAADDIFVARLTGETVRQAVNTLSPMQRACFELVAIRGMDIEQVAAMYGISESTVRQHIFRARTALRTLLGDDMLETQ